MFVEGEIKSYIIERGFGFIAIDGESKDLFFHIKDFPNKSVEPKLGEKLKFRIVEENGKLKADQIVRLDLKQNTAALEDVPQQRSYSNNSASPRFNERNSKGRIFTVIGLIVIAVLAVVVYNKYQDYRQAQQLKAQQLMQQQVQIVEQQREALGDLPDRVLSEEGQRNLEDQTYLTNKPRSEKVSASIEKQNAVQHQQPSQFKCDGRQHCSQMNSRAEAEWFVQHCPDNKMDGDGDKIPCENDSRW